MNSDLAAVAVLLPQPLLDRVEQLRRSRHLSSIQEALLIVVSEYFASQPAHGKSAVSDPVSRLEARLSHTEALLAAVVGRLNRLEGHVSQSPIAADLAADSAADSDEIEDEPDEVMQSFLEPERRSPAAKSAERASDAAWEEAISFGQNLGWAIHPNGKVQPLTYDEIEDEPDEILYDFLEPGSPET